jgi:hypothetical protein
MREHAHLPAMMGFVDEHVRQHFQPNRHEDLAADEAFAVTGRMSRVSTAGSETQRGQPAGTPAFRLSRLRRHALRDAYELPAAIFFCATTRIE